MVNINMWLMRMFSINATVVPYILPLKTKCRVHNTLQGTNISPKNWHFESMIFLFPVWWDMLRFPGGICRRPMGDSVMGVFSQVRGSAPFKMRLFASQPLGVRDLDFGFWDGFLGFFGWFFWKTKKNG